MKKRKQEESSRALLPKIKIKVLGIGGGGGSIVSEIAKSLRKISFIAVDTDFQALKRVEKFVRTFPLGKNVTYGLGTGMNPALAQKVAIAEKERISKILKDQDLVILVSSLGGGVGSGMSPIFAEISQSLGNKTFGFFTLPFKFEGEKKSEIALHSLESMKRFLNIYVPVPNENIFKVAHKNLSLQEALTHINEILIRNLEELIEIIYRPGLINVDFADLRTILSERGKLVFLNTLVASGEKRVEKTIQELFFNPLLSYELVAERILFNITGGKDLKMLEVERIGKAISKLNPRAKIIFGIRRDSHFKNQIKTTLLVVGKEKEIRETSLQKQESKEKRKEAKKSKEVRKVRKKEEKRGKEKEKEKDIPPKELKTREVQEVSGEEERRIPLRRNALEVKKAEKLEELEKLAQDEELEIPTFLRKNFPKS